MKKALLYLVVFVSTCSMYSCTKDTAIAPAAPAACAPGNISYATNVQPLLNAKCFSCHNTTTGAAQPDWSVYTTYKSYVSGTDLVNTRLSGSTGGQQMPQGGPYLSTAEIDTITTLWAQEGFCP